MLKLEVTEQEAQMLVAALAAQPFKDVYQLVFKLDQQIKAAADKSAPAASEG